MARGGDGSGIVVSKLMLLCLLLVAACSGGPPIAAAGLQVGFYSQSCSQAESIVRNVTWSRVASDPSIPAKLLRAYFHDCFPQGCDASVLLRGKGTESAAGPNLSLGALDVVDEAKAALEAACPGTVSCADALALAARDAVSFEFRRALWDVETGRRDARFSDEADAMRLPSPLLVFAQLRDEFAARGLGVEDLVALSGAHTLGKTSCQFVYPRVWQFQGNGGVDPFVEGGYADALRRRCPSPSTDIDAGVPLDPLSEFGFDSGYYAMLVANRGALHTDSALMHDAEAARLVSEMRDRNRFHAAFARSIQKLGAFRVLTGNDGEIRRHCRSVN